jgi:hypothetical protein
MIVTTGCPLRQDSQDFSGFLEYPVNLVNPV